MRLGRENNKNGEYQMKWNQLESLEGLKELNKRSDNTDIVIFKHSTSCGISRMVLRNFEREMDGAEHSSAEFYFLDLLKYRPVSNEISDFYDIRHESPQLLQIRKGTVIAHSSHSNISLGTLVT